MIQAIFSTLVASTALQSALATLLVAVIGFVIHRFVWARHIVSLALSAYEYAEAEGIFRGLQAYEKFEPFMRKFMEKYYEAYGKEPSAKVKGAAVRAMEEAVEKEPRGN